MKMPYVLVVLFGLATTIATAATTAPAKPLTEQEKAAKHERFLQRTGGVIDKVGAGRLVVANLQKEVDTAYLDEYLNPIMKALRVVIDRTDVEKAFAIKDAQDLKTDIKANAAVFIVSDPALPVSLIAPEQNWGLVNVSALMADKPEKKLLDRRVRKAFLRVLALTFGAYSIDDATSPLQTVSQLSDLDSMVITGLTMRELTGMNGHLPKIGVTPAKRTTYLRACMDGWAPAPTNNYQKAVWERVKAEKENGPTNPLKITPPKK